MLDFDLTRAVFSPPAPGSVSQWPRSSSRVAERRGRTPRHNHRAVEAAPPIRKRPVHCVLSSCDRRRGLRRGCSAIVAKVSDRCGHSFPVVGDSLLHRARNKHRVLAGCLHDRVSRARMNLLSRRRTCLLGKRTPAPDAFRHPRLSTEASARSRFPDAAHKRTATEKVTWNGPSSTSAVWTIRFVAASMMCTTFFDGFTRKPSRPSVRTGFDPGPAQP